MDYSNKQNVINKMCLIFLKISIQKILISDPDYFFFDNSQVLWDSLRYL